MMKRNALISIIAAAILGLNGVAALAQSHMAKSSASESRPRTVTTAGDKASADGRLNPADAITPSEEAAIQSHINSVYSTFYSSYRLGPGDILGIYIDRHPEDSLPRVTVSPVGQIYFPLLGNVPVVGRTLPQLQQYFSTAVAEFIREPRVTVALLESQSSKIGVLGDVRTPGVLPMGRPMRVLDAITAAGGILDTGSQKVSILRQYEDGRVQMLAVDVKRILKGKASPEENAYLRAGDTIIVHGNLFKKITKVSSLVGLTTLVTFLSGGAR
jgi:polysaccharide export outer membrane protein